MRKIILAVLTCALAVLGLTALSGTASADTVACTNAQNQLRTDQAKLATDQATLANTPATIPDPNNTGQVIANPAYTAAQQAVNADQQQIASDQVAVNRECTTPTTTPSPTTTPVPTPTPTTTPCPVGQHPDRTGACVPNHVFPGGRSVICGNGTGTISGTTCTLPNGLSCTIPAGATTCSVTFPGNGGHRRGGRLGDHVIIINNGPALDVCGAPTYNTFVDRYGVYRDDINDVLGPDPVDRYRVLRGGCNTTTTVNGNCTTVVTDYNNYQVAVHRWNSLAAQYRGLALNDTYRNQLRSAYRDRLTWQDRFTRDRTILVQQPQQVVTTCQAPTTVTNLQVAAPPANCGCTNVTPQAVAPAPTYQAPAPEVQAPAPAPSYTLPPGGGSVIPQGPVNTGGDDPAFALLWPWS